MRATSEWVRAAVGIQGVTVHSERQQRERSEEAEGREPCNCECIRAADQ